MSQVQKNLSDLTEQFFADVAKLPDTSEGNVKARDLLREFTAKARSFTVRREIDEAKDVILDALKDIASAPKGKLTFSKPEDPAEYTRVVQYKFTDPNRVFILDTMTVPVGSFLKTEERKGFRILSVEPVWDAALTQKCYLCTAEEEVTSE